MARIYKEGQGKWARGILVVSILLGVIYGLSELHENLPSSGRIDIPLLGFGLNYRYLIHAPLLIGGTVLAFWLFNRPATADFLIDTENELKNKVTWPSRKEEVSSSVVVVVTVLVLGVFIFVVDLAFKWVNERWYGLDL